MIARVVIAFAALTGPLPKAGVVAVALLAALVLLARSRRARALAMLGALVLCPVLLLSDIWNSPQLRVVHRHPLEALVAALVLIALLAAAATVIARRPAVLARLAALALPFRVPIYAGGSAHNLLVPLYFVIAAGALAWLVPGLLGRGRSGDAGPAGDPPARGPAQWVERLLVLYIVLYAIQAVYSSDFENALQNMVFFYVPFALLYRLLRRLHWTRELVRDCLRLTIALAILFSLIGFFEYATKTIILNPKLGVANGLHTYFTVNSVFFDPDIFGRYLALAMILLADSLIYDRPQREQAGVTLVLALLWACLLLTLSRSSLGALLIGLAVLAALRWHPSRALVVAVLVVAVGALAVVVSPTTFGLNQGVDGASSGRGGLVSGGLSLFADRPVWGFGSGSFVKEYKAHHRATATTLSASHTIPVTIAAEQGLIGELAYGAFVIAAILCLIRGARGDPVRSAIAAAFLALLFHTLLYADFLEDPVTWVLLAVGVALATASASPRAAPAVERAAAPAGYRGVV
jgi:putative inorganic carbon (HCO3(-)) transporter